MPASSRPRSSSSTPPAQHPPQGDLLPDPGAPALLADGGRILNLPPASPASPCRVMPPTAAMKGASRCSPSIWPRSWAPGHRGQRAGPRRHRDRFGGGVVRDNKGSTTFSQPDRPWPVGQPDDIGGAIAALLSDDCRWITAQRIGSPGRHVYLGGHGCLLTNKEGPPMRGLPALQTR